MNKVNKKKKSQNEIENGIKDATEMAKTGANLAKNVGTGNALGAAKDGVKLLKNKKQRILKLFFVFFIQTFFCYTKYCI